MFPTITAGKPSEYWMLKAEAALAVVCARLREPDEELLRELEFEVAKAYVGPSTLKFQQTYLRALAAHWEGEKK